MQTGLSYDMSKGFASPHQERLMQTVRRVRRVRNIPHPAHQPPSLRRVRRVHCRGYGGKSAHMNPPQNIADGWPQLVSGSVLC